jgi:Polyketide cyclase / dehydrase and lipid transport
MATTYTAPQRVSTTAPAGVPGVTQAVQHPHPKRMSTKMVSVCYGRQMLTISPGRAETRTISIDAPPSTVFAFLSDARKLPEWAPKFAPTVAPVGDDWAIGSGAGSFVIRLRAASGAATVDIVSPEAETRGAHMRVLHNGRGSEFIFTLIFPVGTSEAVIAQQMRVVEGELRTVREICEAQVGGRC